MPRLPPTSVYFSASTSSAVQMESLLGLSCPEIVGDVSMDWKRYLRKVLQKQTEGRT